MLLNLPLIVF